MSIWYSISMQKIRLSLKRFTDVHWYLQCVSSLSSQIGLNEIITEQKNDYLVLSTTTIYLSRWSNMVCLFAFSICLAGYPVNCVLSLFFLPGRICQDWWNDRSVVGYIIIKSMFTPRWRVTLDKDRLCLQSSYEKQLQFSKNNIIPQHLFYLS